MQPFDVNHNKSNQSTESTNSANKATQNTGLSPKAKLALLGTAGGIVTIAGGYLYTTNPSPQGFSIFSSPTPEPSSAPLILLFTGLTGLVTTAITYFTETCCFAKEEEEDSSLASKDQQKEKTEKDPTNSGTNRKSNGKAKQQQSSASKKNKNLPSKNSEKTTKTKEKRIDPLYKEKLQILDDIEKEYKQTTVVTQEQSKQMDAIFDYTYQKSTNKNKLIELFTNKYKTKMFNTKLALAFTCIDSGADSVLDDLQNRPELMIPLAMLCAEMADTSEIHKDTAETIWNMCNEAQKIEYLKKCAETHNKFSQDKLLQCLKAIENYPDEQIKDILNVCAGNLFKGNQINHANKAWVFDYFNKNIKFATDFAEVDFCHRIFPLITRAYGGVCKCGSEGELIGKIIEAMENPQDNAIFIGEDGLWFLKVLSKYFYYNKNEENMKMLLDKCEKSTNEEINKFLTVLKEQLGKSKFKALVNGSDDTPSKERELTQEEIDAEREKFQAELAALTLKADMHDQEADKFEKSKKASRKDNQSPKTEKEEKPPSSKNNPSIINNDILLSINNFSTTKGALQFINNNVHKVGSDQTYRFGRIKLSNGEPLKVSPDDLILEFHLLTKHKGKVTRTEIALPSCIFAQAREGNKILFSLEGKNFELKLAPSRNNQNSFDECLNGFPKEGCNKYSIFLSKEDIPKEYHLWNKKNMITLSPKAERIEIGKAGCTPLDFTKLLCISDNAKKCSLEKSESLNHKTIVDVFVPGSLDIISIDLIVDSDRLYVHAYPNNEQEFPTKKYYFINLDNGTQKIDKEAILANYDNGILQIHLPYTPETIKIEEDEQPIDFEKENLIKIEEFDWDTELSENEPSIESTTKAITG
jgi:hypothetical protein